MLEQYRNLGSIIRTGIRVRARCEKCGAIKEFTRTEIKKLGARMGYGYSLVDRRCKCRLTPDCDGWNRFDYLMIVWRPMTTDHGILNEVRRDERRRREAANNVISMHMARKRR